MLKDGYGRIATDLRVSVTDRCNLRCTYCMPAEGLDWLPDPSLLTADEIERLTRVFVALGITSVKITGGEPTIRADVVEIVKRMSSIRTAGSEGLDLSMTTNGYTLDRMAVPLREAGLDRVTVSCDSLSAQRFAAITRRDVLDKVLSGLDAAERAGFVRIKVNCVVMAGVNDDEIGDFVHMARRTGFEVRFIEFMPLDADQGWSKKKVVRSSALIEEISASYGLKPLGTGNAGSSPASTFTFTDGSPGSVGFISSVSDPFCDACDRVRLTADGMLRSCLFSLDETDLRGPLRAGADDAELAELIGSTVAAKWAGHKINDADFVRPARSMSQIGG